MPSVVDVGAPPLPLVRRKLHAAVDVVAGGDVVAVVEGLLCGGGGGAAAGLPGLCAQVGVGVAAAPVSKPLLPPPQHPGETGPPFNPQRVTRGPHDSSKMCESTQKPSRAPPGTCVSVVFPPPMPPCTTSRHS